MGRRNPQCARMSTSVEHKRCRQAVTSSAADSISASAKRRRQSGTGDQQIGDGDKRARVDTEATARPPPRRAASAAAAAISRKQAKTSSGKAPLSSSHGQSATNPTRQRLGNKGVKEDKAQGKDDDEEEYEVERVLESRRDSHGEWEFFVKWEGYDSDENSWIPLSNMSEPMQRMYKRKAASLAKEKRGANEEEQDDVATGNKQSREAKPKQKLQKNKQQRTKSGKGTPASEAVAKPEQSRKRQRRPTPNGRQKLDRDGTRTPPVAVTKLIVTSQTTPNGNAQAHRNDTQQRRQEGGQSHQSQKQEPNSLQQSSHHQSQERQPKQQQQQQRQKQQQQQPRQQQPPSPPPSPSPSPQQQTQEQDQLEQQGVTTVQALPRARLATALNTKPPPTQQKQRSSYLKHAAAGQKPRPPPAPGMAYRRRRTGPKSPAPQARSQRAPQALPQLASPTGQGQSHPTLLEGGVTLRATEAQSQLAPRTSNPTPPPRASHPTPPPGTASVQTPAAESTQSKTEAPVPLLAASKATLSSSTSSVIPNQDLPNPSAQATCPLWHP